MRGEIENRERAKQLRDYTGLRWGNITPTDVDGLVEFDDKLFVFIEIKLNSTPLKKGQRVALARSCDAIAKTGRMAVVLIVEHNTPIGTDIDVAPCIVREFRMRKKWREPLRPPLTCRDAIDILLKQAGILL